MPSTTTQIIRLQTRLSYCKTQIRGREWKIIDQIGYACLASGREKNNKEAILAARLARKKMAEGKE